MCFIFVIIIIFIIIIINNNSNNKNIIYLYYSGNLYIFCLSNTLNDCVSGQAETSGRTAEPKVSIDNFHPIRILGEGGFRKVILVKKKPSDGCDQRFAIKVLKKSHIMSFGSVTYTVTEKKALVFASGYRFIETLFSCFETKVIFNFLILLYISRQSLILKFTISLKMYCVGAFANCKNVL